MTDISLRYLLFGEDRGASGVVDKFGAKTEGMASKFAGAFSKLGGAIGGELGDVFNKVGEGIGQLGEHTQGLAPKLAIGAGALTGIGGALELIGSKEKRATDQLDQAIENVGKNAADYKDEIEKVVGAQENLGNSAVATKTALQILTQATHDPTQALKDMTVVSNLAAAQHISLEDAAKKVAAVYTGSGKVLKQYGITMDSVKQAAKALTSAETKHGSAVDDLHKKQQRLADLEQIDGSKKKLTIAQEIALRHAREQVREASSKLAQTVELLTAAEERNKKATTATKDAVGQLGDAVKGQAQKNVDNWAGRLDVLKVKIEDWGAKVAQFTGGPLTVLGTVLGVTTGIMEVFTAWHERAAAAQAVETGATVRGAVAQKAAAIASKGWAAAQWLLNAALNANPIGLVIIAVAALIAIFVVAWKHSETFRNIVRGALHDVLGIFQAVWGWIKSNWPYLLGILLGPIALAAAFIFKHWDAVVAFFKAMPGRISGAVHGMWDGIASAFKSVINTVIGWWNSFVGHLKIPGFHAGPVHFGGVNIGGGLQIPQLAAGGVVTRPTMLIAGEAGPEAIIPLNRAMPAASGQDVHVHVHFDGIVGDPITAGRQVVQVLDKAFQGAGIKPAFAR